LIRIKLYVTPRREAFLGQFFSVVEQPRLH
jgi:hypothetical protein